MTVCTKILVPVDGSAYSEKTLRKALELGKQTGAEVVMLNVVDMNSSRISNLERGVMLDQLPSLKSEGEALIRDVCARVPEAAGIRSRVEIGAPANRIVMAAEDEQADLIVMGHRGLSPLAEVVLGSVSHSVIQRAPCSVFIVR